MKAQLKTLRTALGSVALGALLIAPVAQAEYGLHVSGMDTREVGHFAPSNTSFEASGIELLSTGILNSQVGHFAARVSDTGNAPLYAGPYGRTELSNR